MLEIFARVGAASPQTAGRCKFLISQRGLRPREAEPACPPVCLSASQTSALIGDSGARKKLEDMSSANCLNFLHVAAAAVTEVTSEHHARAFYSRSVRDNNSSSSRRRQGAKCEVFV